MASYPASGESTKQVFDVMPKVYNTRTHRMEYAFFADRSPKFLNALARFLEKETFPADSVIITEGEVGFNMYFIYSGSVDVFVGSAMTKVATLRRGTCFGEMALFGASKRMATVKSAERTDLLVVKRRVFSALLRKFPEEKLYFSQMAQKRLDELEAKKLRCPSKSNSEDSFFDSSDSEESDVDLPPLDPNYNRSMGVYGNDEEKSPVDVNLVLPDERRPHTPLDAITPRIRTPVDAPGATLESRPPSSSASWPAKLSPIPRKPSVKRGNVASNIARRPSLPVTPRSASRPASSSFERRPSLLQPTPPPASSSSERRASIGLKAARHMVKKIIEDDFDLDADTGFGRRHTD
eukprot:TRINITY_DN89722_c0_g1_i1.p1 TRINITY_DN89722_c0_g1~~TRINITY_DN89722_c0_g1_i1.p1  ORF type:complete len:351 (-),score=51.64 TRINITY_DN89722_c0_g1_i1:384-1436(-)